MATKTIDHMEFYVDVTPYQHETAGDQTFNVINVCVAYRKGQGFVAYYHPGWNTGWGGFGCLFDFSKDPLTAGFTVLVEQATKNNVKRLTTMHESLKLAAEGIRYFFDRRGWQMLRWLMENTARAGYTPTIEAKVRECMEAETTGKTTETTEDNNSNNNQNNSEDEVMTNETMKVTDLIGKSLCNGNAKYVIKSVEGDKVTVDFAMGDNAAKEMNMKTEQIEKLLQGGWTVQGSEECRVKSEEGSARRPEGESQFATAQEEPKGEESAAKTVTMGETKKPRGTMPKSKVTLRKKQPQTETKAEEPKPEHKAGKLVYSAYTNKKGKTCAKVSGFAETDAAYQQAVSLHGSASYETVKGERVNFLTFGPRYAEVAKTVCQMLNEGKSLDDCQAVVDAATEERMAKREERKQKRETYRQEHEEHGAANLKPETKVNGKAYSSADVAAILQKVMAGGKLPKDIEDAMKAA